MFPTMHVWDREASKITIQITRPTKRSRRASQGTILDVLEPHAHDQQAAKSFKTKSGRRNQMVYQSPSISAPILTTNMATYEASLTAQAISHDLLPPSARHPPEALSAFHKILTNPTHLSHIFTHLPLPTLLTCQRVCKTWNTTLTTSRHWREHLYTASAQIQRTKPPTLNPLLTTINTSASRYHPIYSAATPILREDDSIVLSWKGRFYRPEAFFDRASNPSMHFHVTSESESDRGGITTAQPTHIEWQLRELSRFEVCRLFLDALLSSHQDKNKKNDDNIPTNIDEDNEENTAKPITILSSTSSLWKMYLCQPPPTEIHVTVWAQDDHHLDGYNNNGSGSSSARITEKYTLKAWTLREIFQRMDDVRRARRSTSKYSKPSAADNNDKDRGKDKEDSKDKNKDSNGNSNSSNNIIIVGSLVGNKLVKRKKEKEEKKNKKEKVDKSKGSMTWSI